MTTPSATPQYPRVPHTTPASRPGARASGRAPVFNPYDKFTQHQFDAFIGDVTGQLRRALKLEARGTGSAKHPASTEDSKTRYSAIEDQDQVADDLVEDSFAEIRARRLAKGKQRATECLGNEDEPIVLDSDEGEASDEELYEEYNNEGWGAPHRASRIGLTDEEEEEGTGDDDTDDDEVVDEEGEDEEDEAGPSITPHPPRAFVEVIEIMSEDEEEAAEVEREVASGGEGEEGEEFEEEAASDDEQSEDEVEEDYDVNGGRARFAARYYAEGEEKDQDYEAAGYDISRAEYGVAEYREEQVSIISDSEDEHVDEEAGVSPQEIQERRPADTTDSWTGPSDLAEGFDSVDDLSAPAIEEADSRLLLREANDEHSHSVGNTDSQEEASQMGVHGPAEGDDELTDEPEEGVAENARPERSTNPRPAEIIDVDELDDEGPELLIQIPDPWSGPRMYAEDFYAGGELRESGPEDGLLSPSHLTPRSREASPLGDVTAGPVFSVPLDATEIVVQAVSTPRSTPSPANVSQPFHDSQPLEMRDIPVFESQTTTQDPFTYDDQPAESATSQAYIANQMFDELYADLENNDSNDTTWLDSLMQGTDDFEELASAATSQSQVPEEFYDGFLNSSTPPLLSADVDWNVDAASGPTPPMGNYLPTTVAGTTEAQEIFEISDDEKDDLDVSELQCEEARVRVYTPDYAENTEEGVASLIAEPADFPLESTTVDQSVAQSDGDVLIEVPIESPGSEESASADATEDIPDVHADDDDVSSGLDFVPHLLEESRYVDLSVTEHAAGGEDVLVDTEIDLANEVHGDPTALKAPTMHDIDEGRVEPVKTVELSATEGQRTEEADRRSSSAIEAEDGPDVPKPVAEQSPEEKADVSTDALAADLLVQSDAPPSTSIAFDIHAHDYVEDDLDNSQLHHPKDGAKQAEEVTHVQKNDVHDLHLQTGVPMPTFADPSVPDPASPIHSPVSAPSPRFEKAISPVSTKSLVESRDSTPGADGATELARRHLELTSGTAGLFTPGTAEGSLASTPRTVDYDTMPVDAMSLKQEAYTALVAEPHHTYGPTEQHDTAEKSITDTIPQDQDEPLEPVHHSEPISECAVEAPAPAPQLSPLYAGSVAESQRAPTSSPPRDRRALVEAHEDADAEGEVDPDYDEMQNQVETPAVTTMASTAVKDETPVTCPSAEWETPNHLVVKLFHVAGRQVL